jgi:AcrR family transcriptional regulator
MVAAISASARHILEGALRVIGRLGVDAVTHRAVAAEAGVSPGAVAHHFATRDGVVEAALRFAIGRELERLRGFALELQSKAFDRTRWLDAVVGWYARELETDPATHVACYEAFVTAARDERYREIVREWFDTYERSAELAMRAAGSSDPVNHASVFVSTLMGIVLQQLAAPRRKFRQVARAQLAALVDALVGSHPPPPTRTQPSTARRKVRRKPPA